MDETGVLGLLEELSILLEESKPVFGKSNFRQVDISAAFEIMDEIRDTFPSEFSQARQIVRERQSLLDDAEVEAMDQKSALALIRALRLAPNGVIRRNVATDGSVEVSSNIGVVATSDDEVKIMLSPRSSITSLQNEFKDRLQTLADVLGFDAKFEFEYPGWSYAEHSPVRDVFVESYRELFGSELRIESIHAGLECGLFAEALHGLDAIAVGPTLSDVHTPDESMELASAERFYELLIDVLKRLAA